MATWKAHAATNPLWSTSAFPFVYDQASITLAAGCSFVTSPAHPMRVAAVNEQYVKCDGSNATSHECRIEADGGTETGSGSAILNPPDQTVRWGRFREIYFRYDAAAPAGVLAAINATNGSGTFFGNTIGLYMNDAGQLVAVYQWSATVGDYSYLGVAQTALTTSHDYLLQEMIIFNDDSGQLLLKPYYVLRLIDNVTTTCDETTLIVAPLPITWTDNTQSAPSFPSYYGETTQRTGFVFYIGTPSGSWQDANNPLGPRRIDVMYPDGVGAYTNFNAVNANNVDDNVGGNDVNDADKDTLAVSGTKQQLYTLGNPVGNIVAGDTVVSVQNAGRIDVAVATDKTQTGAAALLERDSATATDRSVSTAFISVTGPRTEFAHVNTRPDGTRWVFGDLANYQIGFTCPFAGTARNVSITDEVAIISYVKSGETLPAVSAKTPAECTGPLWCSAGAGVF